MLNMESASAIRSKLKVVSYAVGQPKALRGPLLQLLNRGRAGLRRLLQLALRALPATKRLPKALGRRMLDDMGLIETYSDLRFGFRHRVKYGRHAYWGHHSFRVPNAGDVGIIFFCGLGDALYGLSTLREISERLHAEKRRFYAFTMAATDQYHNSDLREFLDRTSLFDSVSSVPGRPTEYWKYYDWSAVIDVAPAGCVLFPYLYKTSRQLPHRIDGVRTQFSLPKGAREIPIPARHPSTYAKDLVAKLKGARKVILLHLDARSTGYRYPHAAELVRTLIDEGLFVASFTSIDGVEDPSLLHLSPGMLSLFDTAYLLKEVAAPVVAINSVLWPMGLATRNRLLGLHYLKASDGHHFHYDEMRFVSPMKYCVDRVSNGILASPGVDYVDNKERPTIMIDYRPEAVLKWIRELGWL